MPSNFFFQKTFRIRDGVLKTSGDLSDCDPAIYNGNFSTPLMSVDGVTTQTATETAFPCGSMARSFFNDTFALYNTDNGVDTQIDITSKGIAWPDDKLNKFKNIKNDDDSTTTNTTAMNMYQWLDVEDGIFYWFFLKIFRKVHGLDESGCYAEFQKDLRKNSKYTNCRELQDQHHKQ